jgi:multiple sugar transport system permease protein
MENSITKKGKFRPFKSRMAVRNQLWGYLFISPWLIGLLAFIVIPMLISIGLSFTHYEVITPARWAGLENYITIFTDDPLFIKSLYNTIYYTVFYIPINVSICLIMALLLTSKVRGVTLFRTLVYIPNIVPTVALALIWMVMFNSQFGVINWFIRLFGLPGPEWLASPIWSKPAIIIMNLYKAGFTALIFVAALQQVPLELYDAASIDGAGGIRKFFYVTLPMISPAILFSVIMGTIGSFQLFTEAYITTGGGPLDSTLFYGLYLYKKAFGLLQMGYATALAWILFSIILALTLIQLRISKKMVYYEGGEG